MEEIEKNTDIQHFKVAEKLKVLDGSLVDVHLKCQMTLRIGETKSKHEFWIVPMTAPCLLGGDFLRSHDCIIDYQRMILTIDYAEVPTESPAEKASSPEVLRVVLKHPLKLKPYTEAVMRGRVIGADKQSGWRIVRPQQEFCESENGEVMIGRTLVDLRKGYRERKETTVLKLL